MPFCLGLTQAPFPLPTHPRLHFLVLQATIPGTLSYPQSTSLIFIIVHLAIIITLRIHFILVIHTGANGTHPFTIFRMITTKHAKLLQSHFYPFTPFTHPPTTIHFTMVALRMKLFAAAAPSVFLSCENHFSRGSLTNIYRLYSKIHNLTLIIIFRLHF